MIEYILEKWPDLTIVFFYLILFLPVIFLNTLVVLVIISGPLLFVVLPLVPRRYLDSLKSVDGDRVEKRAFLLGRFIRDLRDDLTDMFPFSLPKKTVIIPLQKRILGIFIGIYESVIKGFVNGIKEGFRVYKSRDADASRTARYKQILLFPFNLLKALGFILFLVLVLAVLSAPTIFFVYLCLLLL